MGDVNKLDPGFGGYTEGQLLKVWDWARKAVSENEVPIPRPEELEIILKRIEKRVRNVNH